jgi:hypothetical protein
MRRAGRPRARRRLDAQRAASGLAPSLGPPELRKSSTRRGRRRVRARWRAGCTSHGMAAFPLHCGCLAMVAFGMTVACSSSDSGALFSKSQGPGGGNAGKADDPSANVGGSASGGAASGGAASGGAASGGAASGGAASGGAASDGAAGWPPILGGTGGVAGAGGTTSASASCQDHCGGPSDDGTCYCDAACLGYGDCCGDVSVCAQTTTPGCSPELCNGDQPSAQDGNACYCDTLCTQYGDCCANKQQVCGP